MTDTQSSVRERNRVSLGDILAAARKDHGLTKRQLARLAGVRPGLIDSIEKGREMPGEEVLKKIWGAMS